ncbi:hypothetical protein [Legionella tunisiensis]|uniref:hypothetical protein n=1 Tax=Legionella tunisiensis TaxID=1034944 RepID=UPI00031AD507|nr:hypothetical protein [Legionella tunisiensis]
MKIKKQLFEPLFSFTKAVLLFWGGENFSRISDPGQLKSVNYFHTMDNYKSKEKITGRIPEWND